MRGMLWQGKDDKQDVLGRIKDALAHFVGKYQERPLLALVNNADADAIGSAQTVAGVEVGTAANVLPKHVFVVVER